MDQTAPQTGGIATKLAELRSGLVRNWTRYDGRNKAVRSARLLICMYFLNQAYTGFEIWWWYRQPFPWINCWLAPCSILVALDVQTIPMGSLMAAIATYDAIKIISTQLTVWYVHGYLYINELMVKKMSLLGAAVLILALNWKEKRGSSHAGVLLETAAEAVMSDKKSAVMLVGRLLLSTLFLYVGYTEVKRQWESSVTDAQGYVHSRRAKGDGHDSMMSKLVQFILSIPFTVGFKSNTTALCLAAVLTLEAMTSWLWFLSKLNIGYRIHAREHFVVNIGVAGALVLFAHIGAGKYSIDALRKKND